MQIEVQIKPNSRKNKIIEKRERFLKVAVKAPPIDGRANLELLKFLKKHFRAEVKLISGKTSKKKIIEMT